jgi:hypothetical protein
MVLLCYSTINSSPSRKVFNDFYAHPRTVAHRGGDWFLCATAMPVQIKCELCGKSVVVPPSRKASRRFCSRQCMLENLRRLSVKRTGRLHQNYVERVEVKCAVCGAKKLVYPKQFKSNIAHCCSPQCTSAFRISSAAARVGNLNPNWLGGCVSYRGPNWKSARRNVLQRDGGRCCVCGKTSSIVHHVVPFRLFNNWSEANLESNLQTLCSKHHTSVEHAFWNTHPELVTKGLQNAGEIACSLCGAMFKSDLPAHRLCWQCRYVSCRQCGKQINVMEHCKRRKAVYCSRKCYELSAKGRDMSVASMALAIKRRQLGDGYADRLAELT